MSRRRMPFQVWAGREAQNPPKLQGPEGPGGSKQFGKLEG